MPSVRESLSAAELLRIAKRLLESLPITDAYEAGDRAERARKSGRARKTASYRSQREHIDRWLSEYDSPGYYNRKTSGHDAKFFYNHFKCVAGLIWLAEALDLPQGTVEEGVAAVKAAKHNPASECGAFRKVMPWTLLAPRLRRHMN